MATVLRMPGISADSTEASMVEWTVTPGTKVTRGEVVASVETEKAIVDLEAEEDGVLLKTLAEAGDTVPVGDPIAVFVQDGEQAQGEESILASLGLGPAATGQLQRPDEDRSQDALVPGAEVEIERAADDVVATNGAAAGGQRLFASPIARRLATSAGLSLQDLQGSGPGGRIGRRDVERAMSQQAPEPAAAAVTAAPLAAAAAGPSSAPASTASPVPVASAAGWTDVPHSKFRRAVAAALTASKQQVPHFYLKATCRVDPLLELRQRINAEGGVKITINDFVVKAAARAMVEVPDMNVIWTADAVRRFESVDIAVAMASERGLLTPVVRSVQTRSMSDLSTAIKDLSARGNAGSLKQHELEGGSLAVSNLGMFGVEEFAAIINPPQVGILAVGAVSSQAVETSDGGLALAKVVTVVLSTDHRPVDGAVAAQWLREFKTAIENPFRLLV